jgi:hypothetical protein
VGRLAGWLVPAAGEMEVVVALVVPFSSSSLDVRQRCPVLSILPFSGGGGFLLLLSLVLTKKGSGLSAYRSYPQVTIK